MFLTLLTVIGVALSTASWSRGENVARSEKCFYYRIVVATLEMQQRGSDQLILSVVEIYRQGQKLRIVGEQGEIWLTDGKRAVFFQRDARKGWMYPSLPDGFVLSKLGGIAFPVSLMVTERILFPTKPLRTEKVGSSMCIVWESDGLLAVVGVSNGSKGRMTIWVPSEEGAMPIGFQKLQFSIENRLVAEARLVEAKEVTCNEELFSVSKDVALVTIISRDELFKMVNIPTR